MAPNDCFEPGRWRARPSETEKSSNLFQGIGERWKIDPSENKREKVHRVLDGSCCCRTFTRPTITIAHSFQEHRLVVTVMHEQWIGYRRKDVEEFSPYSLLPFVVVGPNAVLNRAIAASDANADQVI